MDQDGIHLTVKNFDLDHQYIILNIGSNPATLNFEDGTLTHCDYYYSATPKAQTCWNGGAAPVYTNVTVTQ